MPYYLFTWTDEIIGHLAENGVTPEEFEEVVCDPQLIGTSRSTGRPIAIGQDGEGRTLICVYELLDDVRVLPVTAFEPEAD